MTPERQSIDEDHDIGVAVLPPLHDSELVDRQPAETGLFGVGFSKAGRHSLPGSV